MKLKNESALEISPGIFLRHILGQIQDPSQFKKIGEHPNFAVFYYNIQYDNQSWRLDQTPTHGPSGLHCLQDYIHLYKNENQKQKNSFIHIDL